MKRFCSLLLCIVLKALAKFADKLAIIRIRFYTTHYLTLDCTACSLTLSPRMSLCLAGPPQPAVPSPGEISTPGGQVRGSRGRFKRPATWRKYCTIKNESGLIKNVMHTWQKREIENRVSIDTQSSRTMWFRQFISESGKPLNCSRTKNPLSPTDKCIDKLVKWSNLGKPQKHTSPRAAPCLDASGGKGAIHLSIFRHKLRMLLDKEALADDEFRCSLLWRQRSDFQDPDLTNIGCLVSLRAQVDASQKGFIYVNGHPLA